MFVRQGDVHLRQCARHDGRVANKRNDDDSEPCKSLSCAVDDDDFSFPYTVVSFGIEETAVVPTVAQLSALVSVATDEWFLRRNHDPVVQ